MEIQDVEKVIKAGIPDADIRVEGEGCSFAVTVVSSRFDRLPQVKRQQRVLETLKWHLRDGRLHAVSVKAFTPTEWEERREPQRAEESRLIQLQ